MPLFLLTAGLPATAIPAGGLPDTLRCSQKANGQLEKWESRNEFLPAGDATFMRSPTSRVGTWVVVTLDNERVTSLSRISAEGETVVTLDPACRSSLESRPAPGPAPGSHVLTDEDVEALLDSNDAGVFYAWSPHMPLSVDGWAEISAAAENLHITATPVLNSHANIDYARDRALRVDMPPAGFAVSHSIELGMRDLNVHAPAILVYSRGRFVSPVIPGFRYSRDYEELIGRFIGSR